MLVCTSCKLLSSNRTVRSSATLSCRGQDCQCSPVDCLEQSWSEMLDNIPGKKRPRTQISPTSACSSGAAHFIPLQFLILILIFWFSACEEFIDVTGDSPDSEDISLTANDSGSVVVSSEWQHFSPSHSQISFFLVLPGPSSGIQMFSLTFRAETHLWLTCFR